MSKPAQDWGTNGDSTGGANGLGQDAMGYVNSANAAEVDAAAQKERFNKIAGQANASMPSYSGDHDVKIDFLAGDNNTPGDPDR